MIGPGDDAVVLYDCDSLAEGFSRLRAAFPEDALHAVAVKANPLARVLRFLRERGAGAEAASLPELRLALEAGQPPERIVFDSPAKTVSELAFALKAGINVNADNLDELTRIEALLRDIPSASRIGIRINPQVGQGRIAATSVAGLRSKFGVPLSREEELAAAFTRHPWLGGVHVHVGSQGCSLDMLVSGARAVYDFTRRLHEGLGERRVTVFDLGGGLPAVYGPDDPHIDFADYASALRREIPGLFDGSMRLVTEFGRSLHAPCALAASRVEYVKRDGDRQTLVIHLGADMFLRECYNPGDWRHAVELLDARGRPREGTPTPTDIAGPLCFSGDYPARDVVLPRAEPGDVAVVRDAGAYTFSMWSRYNSRTMPRFLGWLNGAFHVLKEREPVEDALAYWS